MRHGNAPGSDPYRPYPPFAPTFRSTARGKVMVTVVPLPGRLVSSISPPFCLTMPYTVDRPSPCFSARLLVEKKVAASIEDVNTVLLTGFYHAYGPVNEYFN